MHVSVPVRHSVSHARGRVIDRLDTEQRSTKKASARKTARQTDKERARACLAAGRGEIGVAFVTHLVRVFIDLICERKQQTHTTAAQTKVGQNQAAIAILLRGACRSRNEGIILDTVRTIAVIIDTCANTK